MQPLSIKKILLFFLGPALSTLLLACSHFTESSNSHSDFKCLSRSSVRIPLQSLNALYDSAATNAAEQSAPLKIVKDDCWKQIYHRGQYQIVIYQSESKPDQAAGLIAPLKKTNIYNPQCMNKALQDIQGLNLAFTQKMIADYQDQFPRSWQDPDIGPINWLDCHTTNPAIWFASVATFLHEISHGLSRDNCLYIENQDLRCLNVQHKPPTTEIARLEVYPTDEEKIKNAIDFVQNLYLHPREELWTYLDEIRAYTLTTATETAVLRKFGPEGLYQKVGEESSRNYLILPQMLMHLAQYLNRFRTQQPELFLQFWTPENSILIFHLLDNAEIAYKNWVAHLNATQQKVRPLEDSFWQSYNLEIKKFKNQ